MAALREQQNFFLTGREDATNWFTSLPTENLPPYSGKLSVTIKMVGSIWINLIQHRLRAKSGELTAPKPPWMELAARNEALLRECLANTQPWSPGFTRHSIKLAEIHNFGFLVSPTQLNFSPASFEKMIAGYSTVRISIQRWVGITKFNALKPLYICGILPDSTCW